MLGLLVIIYWFAGESTAVGEYSSHILPEPKFYESSCYGVADEYVDFQFNCTSDDSSIAVSSVIAAAKPLTKNCSDVMSSGINSEYHERCCTVDQERDCNATYHNTNDSLTYEIQSVCNGYQKCPSPVRTPWMRVGCNNTVYPLENNYMIVDYFCIKKSKIAVLQSSNKSLKGRQSVYLQSAGYPCDTTYSNDEEWCQIEVSDAAIPIQVVAIDIKLAENASIVFKEAKGCKESEYKITYENNNKYQIVNIFNLTNTVFLSYRTGSFSSARFWIGFVSNQNISITCGVTINENCTTKLLLNTFSNENKKACSGKGGITSGKLQTTNPNKNTVSTTDKDHNSTIDSTTNSTIANYKYQSPGYSTESTTTANKDHNPRSSTESTTTANKDHNPRSSTESTTTANKDHNPRSSTESTTTANKDHNPRSSTESTTTVYKYPKTSFSKEGTTFTKKYHSLVYSTHGTKNYKNHSLGYSSFSTRTTYRNHSQSISSGSIRTTNTNQSLSSSTDSTRTTNKNASPSSSPGSTNTTYKNNRPALSKDSTTTYKNPRSGPPRDSTTTTTENGTSTTNNNTAKAGNSSSQTSCTETPPTNNTAKGKNFKIDFTN
ncbi:mucin-5AC-like [Saccostrea cucullata]|uniref:mucin-5AC-like n=1 Tax=Saccostrea cuccullata TaxID=36930 RepID=UPI002ED31984